MFFIDPKNLLEANAKLGFWFQIKADARVNPEAYCGISRT
jgi:hypothetical protein